MFSTADQEGGEKGDDCVDSFFTMSSCMQQNEVKLCTRIGCRKLFVLYNCSSFVPSFFVAYHNFCTLPGPPYFSFFFYLSKKLFQFFI